MDVTKFNDVEGFGVGSQEEIDALSKAIAADYTTDFSSTSGGALRVESLESTLKVLTYREQHMVLFKSIPKKAAFSTVEEYSQLTNLGDDNTGFTPEGVLPEAEDAKYARKASLVKFLGTTRVVTHPMTLVNQVGGNAVAREINNGTLKIMRDAEFGLFYGDSDLVFNPSSVEGPEFDGLSKLIDSSMVLDLSNRNIEEGDVGDCARAIFDNYGMATDIYLSTGAANALAKNSLPKERIILPSSGALQLGVEVERIKTQYGTVNLNPSVFLNGFRSPKKTAPSSATSTKAPTAPASIAAAAMTGSTGKFRSSQLGVIQFKVTACNRFGESAPTAAGGSTTVTSSDYAKYIPLTITNAGSVTVVPEYFNIYATEPGGSTFYYIASVAANSQANSGTTPYNYDGFIMPNTSIGFIGQMTEEVVCFKQLAPLMKMDLARIDPSYRFCILLYGVPQLFNPKRFMKIVNIKDN